MHFAKFFSNTLAKTYSWPFLTPKFQTKNGQTFGMLENERILISKWALNGLKALTSLIVIIWAKIVGRHWNDHIQSRYLWDHFKRIEWTNSKILPSPKFSEFSKLHVNVSFPEFELTVWRFRGRSSKITQMTKNLKIQPMSKNFIFTKLLYGYLQLKWTLERWYSCR